MAESGPSRPTGSQPFDDFRTPKYLRGVTRKMKYDLDKLFRLYAGKQGYIFTVDKTGGRCDECVDSLTGVRTVSTCPTCGATGYVDGYTRTGPYWILAEFGARSLTGTQLGSMDNPAQGRDQMFIIDAPLMIDTDLIGYIDRQELHKIEDIEPRIGAVGGTIIIQAASLVLIPKGAREHSDVTWV